MYIYVKRHCMFNVITSAGSSRVVDPREDQSHTMVYAHSNLSLAILIIRM